MSAIASSRRRHSARPASSKPALPLAAVAACVAVSCSAAGLTVAAAYPIWPALMMAAFIGWSAFAALRPTLALAGLCALLPLAGFAPRTGWLIVEELDLLILATAAGGYAARAWAAAHTARGDASDRRFEPRLSIVALLVLLCYAASMVLSLERGVHAAGIFTFSWTQGFNGPLNSFRLFKSFAWALLLAPLTLDELRRSGRVGGGIGRIGVGLTIGLGLAGLAVLHERLTYTGLLDFSQDYRAVGSFWEMHVGGATLDAFVLLTLPFAVHLAVVLRERHAWLIAVCAVIGLTIYAALATFSRGLYIALVVEAALLAIVMLRRLLRLDGLALALAVGRWALFGAAVAIGDFIVFRHGGYRAVIATVVVLALALRVGALAGRVGPSGWLLSIGSAGVLGFVGWGIATIVPKGPYLVFAIVSGLSIAAIVVAERRPSPLRSTIALALWLWLAIAACVVADLWGGRAAGYDSAMVNAALVLLVVVSARIWPTLWRPDPDADTVADLKRQSATLAVALLIIAPVTVLSAGAYMGDRMQASRNDLGYRIDHWAEAVGRLRTPGDWALGLGLGRYPATSLFSGGKLIPGTYQHVDRPDGAFVTLTGPGLPYLGEGEFYRFTQIVPVQPDRRYVLTLQARSSEAASLHVDLCEKHLIYSIGCVIRDLQTPADGERWTRFTETIDVDALGRSPWYAKKSMVLAIAVGSPRKAVDIRNVHLIGPDGNDVVVNGDFGNGTARWFSSSDLNHPPFHTFNLAVGVLVDQGVVGLGLLGLLVLGVLVHTVLGRARHHADAVFIAIAMAGLLVLGLIDDPIDAPRIAFLFYFVLLYGLMLRNPKATVPSRPAVPEPAPVPVPAATALDESAARALRRQQAFGSRKVVDKSTN